MTTTTEQPSAFEQREAIFRKLARDETLTVEEIGVVSEMDRDEYDAESRRLRCVLKNESLAATSTARKAARKKLTAAETALAKQAPEIAAKISELRQTLTSLERGVKEAADVVERHDRAVAMLRASVPPHVAKFHQTAASLLKGQPQSKRMRELRSIAKMTKNIAAIDISNLDGQEKAKGHAEGYGKNDLLDVTKHRNVTSTKVNPQRWTDYIGRLRAELPKVENELANLEAEYDSSMAKIDKALDHYVS